MQEKLSALMEDNDFASELARAKSISEIEALLAGKGIAASADELKSLVSDAPMGELDEDALEDVSGGGLSDLLYRLFGGRKRSSGGGGAFGGGGSAGGR